MLAKFLLPIIYIYIFWGQQYIQTTHTQNYLLMSIKITYSIGLIISSISLIRFDQLKLPSEDIKRNCEGKKTQKINK